MISDICRGTDFTAASGVLTSPNYPYAYDINTACSKKISVGKHTGKTIVISFTRFDVEFYKDCLWDYVEVSLMIRYQILYSPAGSAIPD